MPNIRQPAINEGLATMKITVTFALALALAAPAYAQDINAGATSGSTSGANSASGAQSDNHATNTQGQSLNGNIGTSTAGATSGSSSNASTRSDSASFGNQQSQGQSNNSSTTQTQGQTATNSQGTSVSNTFNSTPLKRQYIGTNTAVPLAASSSFSSDFCGSTSSGGVSAAPIGISAGFSGTKYDQTCRSLRVAEKAGMMAVNASNMGFKDLAGKLTALSTWSICTANGLNTIDACEKLGLLGAHTSPTDAADAPQSTEEAVKKAASVEEQRINGEQQAQPLTSSTALAQAVQPPVTAAQHTAVTTPR